MKNFNLLSSITLSLFGIFLAFNFLAPKVDWQAKSTSTGIIVNQNLSVNPYCNTPTWPETSNITETSATFSWDPVSGAVSYSVQIRLPNGNWTYLAGSPFYNTYATAYNLSPCTTYEWRVRANCTTYGTYSYWTYPVSFTTSGMTTCYAPSWLITTNITYNTATWEWAPVSNAQSYTVQWRYAGGTWYNLGGPWTNTWLEVGGLDPGTDYEWRVRSNCCDGQYSPWSAIESFTTLGYFSCYTPTWPLTLEITQTSAKLKWDAVSGAENYSVEIRLPYGAWMNVPGSPTSGTWIIAYNLQPCTTYEWRVRANCGYNEYSDWTYPISFTTLCTSTCSTPTWPITLDITQTSAKFKWDPVPGAETYSVEIRLPYGAWMEIPGSPTSGIWIIAYNLQPCTTYEWRVRANCGYYEYSEWTYPISFTTLCTSYCSTPTWPITLDITQTSAKFKWDPVPGAETYSVEIRLPYGAWMEIPGSPTSGIWIIAYNLQPCTTYEWRVRANCGYYEYSDWTYPISFTTLCTSSCATPTWTYTSNITTNSATFHWDEVWGAQSYTVQLQLANGNWYNVQGGPFYNNWVTVYGLSPNTNYCWRVKTNCGSWQYSDWSYPVCFTTLGMSCQAPYWLLTTDITATSATLKWSAVSGAYCYQVQWRYAGGGTWYDLPLVYNNTWVALHNLQPGTSYEWHVRTVCADWQYSAWSQNAYFTTLSNVCYKPSWTNTTNITSTSAILTWSAVWGAQSYSVQYRLPGGTWYDVPGSPTTATSINLNGLNPATTYEWRVRTNCSSWQYSDWTYPVTFTTLGLTCHAPGWVYTLDITETSAKLEWEPVSGALSYLVQWRFPGGDWNDLGTFTESWTILVNLEPGTAYEWHVKTNCSNGMMSDYSATASFTTLGTASLCDTPTGLFTTNITDTSATFNWSAVPDAQYYVVQTREPNGTWNFAPNNPFPDTSATVGGFLPGTAYEWRVQTKCIDGNFSDWSSPVSFTTVGTFMSAGDDCDTAATLTVHTECMNTESTNVGATPSSPPPMGWCPTNNVKDVWFKFTMPADSNPTVTIRTTAGTLTDAIMEVYRGSDCQNLVYIWCEDDNYNGNGQFMPVITVTGTAGETIWVRVWGYAGTTGTFSICVFNYASANFAVPNVELVPDTDGSLDELVSEKITSEAIEVTPHLTISPNPANDQLKVMYTQTESSKVTGILLMDLSGQVILRKQYVAETIAEFREQLDVSRLVPGMYVLHVFTTTGILTEKISVMD